MKTNVIAGKTMAEWVHAHPVLKKIISAEEVIWANTNFEPAEHALIKIQWKESDIREAEERLHRFAPYISKVFPETEKMNGIIESSITEISNMRQSLSAMCQQEIEGSLLLKCDSHLPISGSIKARGGIYEVLKFAEDLAIENKLITINEDYSIFDSQLFRDLFSSYTIIVGSTGNLGLSIGIISAALGFKVNVHMSDLAKKWKKGLLREKGAVVIEHKSDYGKAVEQGRKESQSDSKSYFIDDEDSIDLFLGYSVAAFRLKKQLEEMEVTVDEDHPLFVYLPCGVGGGPGGIAYGLKTIFKDNVHCFFAEPTHSPSMLIGLVTRQHDNVSVHDFGMDNRTIADGLAVGRPSGLVSRIVEHLINGSYTVSDQTLYALLRKMADLEQIKLEPSALAGVYGPVHLFKSGNGQKYIKQNNLTDKMKNAMHIAWATGGSMVPEKEMEVYYQTGLKCNENL